MSTHIPPSQASFQTQTSVPRQLGSHVGESTTHSASLAPQASLVKTQDAP